MITSWPGPPFPNTAKLAVISNGSPCSHSISILSANNPSAISWSKIGAVYAPYSETIIVITSPAIGPAIATSNKILRLIVNPFDWMNAPNVGIPITGKPGIKYGQLVFNLCIFAAIICPSSCVPKIPNNASV